MKGKEVLPYFAVDGKIGTTFMESNLISSCKNTISYLWVHPAEALRRVRKFYIDKDAHCSMFVRTKD